MIIFGKTFEISVFDSKSKMGSSTSDKKRNGQRRKGEDGNVDADTNPENSREILQNMKDIVNCSEQEIYAMLVECNMDAEEAITRLLSQGFFDKVSAFYSGFYKL